MSALRSQIKFLLMLAYSHDWICLKTTQRIYDLLALKEA